MLQKQNHGAKSTTFML